MNRRQFTASIAALFAAPALPLAARAPAAAATATVPPGAYAWAQIIARSQNTCSPDMLARALHLGPQAAKVLFKDMVVDGVLRAPASTGIAKAAAPFDTKSHIPAKARALFDDLISGEDRRDGTPPLVKDDDTGLGCAQTPQQDQTHARTDQSVEEGPDRG